MKAKLFSLFITTIVVYTLTLGSCKKNDDDSDPEPQDIVTHDTSGYTGELTVYTYIDYNGSVNASKESNVFLYANREDLEYDMLSSNNNSFAIYRVYTGASNVAYFGYILMGNYYVLAYKTINDVGYDKFAIVQIRPQQQEELNITMQIAQ